MGDCNYGPVCNYTDAHPQISFIARTGERLTTPKMVYNYLSGSGSQSCQSLSF